ncbi:MAG: hypothetical protein GY774_00490 [Planctomycetes bacterium]|nr:hypothetical protein [Planctomycetota bacterium]
MDGLAGSENYKAGIKDLLKSGTYTDNSVWVPFLFLHNQKAFAARAK